MQWKDKVTVVTGGASGIGAASARNFAARGAKVVVADLNGDGAEASVNALVKAAEDHYGLVEVFFNNAGNSKGGEILTAPLSDWQDQWQVNVMAHV